MQAPTGTAKRKKTRLVDPQLRSLRAIKMVEAKITGKTNAELAEQFNVHPETVIRTLDYAKRAGLVANYEDRILQSLVPSAIDAFADALKRGDTQVALEVLKGTGLLKKQQDKPAPQANENESLEIYIRKIRGNPNEQPAPAKPTLLGQLVARPAVAAIGAGDVIDGDVNEVTRGPVVAEAAAGVCQGGDEDRTPSTQQRVDVSADPA